jgi:hypothetical protein
MHTRAPRLRPLALLAAFLALGGTARAAGAPEPAPAKEAVPVRFPTLAEARADVERCVVGTVWDVRSIGSGRVFLELRRDGTLIRTAFRRDGAKVIKTEEKGRWAWVSGRSSTFEFSGVMAGRWGIARYGTLEFTVYPDGLPQAAETEMRRQTGGLGIDVY